MKYVVYIVLITVLVAFAFAGVKLLKNSDLYANAVNAFDTVSNAIDTVKGAFGGSAGQQNQSTSAVQQGENTGLTDNSSDDDSPRAHTSTGDVTSLLNPYICSLFSISKGGNSAPRPIVVGDVFEEGDVISWNKSKYSYEFILGVLDALAYEHWATFDFGDLYVARLFGQDNSLITAVKFDVNGVTCYYIWLVDGDPNTYVWTSLLNNGFSDLDSIEVYERSIEQGDEDPIEDEEPSGSYPSGIIVDVGWREGR